MLAQREYHFWVYILSSRSRNLYTGMTTKLLPRGVQHRDQKPGTHTARYNIHRLVYFEYFKYVRNAIAREDELKRWPRAQKIALIEKGNPTWDDLLPQLAESINYKLPPSPIDPPKPKPKPPKD
jgi:putative endonuclease